MLEVGSPLMCFAAFSPGPAAYFAGFLATMLIPFSVWLSRHQQFPGRHALIYAHLGAMLWLWAAAFELGVTSAGCKLLATGLAHVGIALAATAWMCFVYRYVVGVSVAGQRAQNLLMVTIPLTAAGMVFTTGLHGLFYTFDTALVTGPGISFMAYDRGPLFFVALGYVYVTLTISLALLLNAALTTQAAGQLRFWLLFMLALVPMLGSFAHLLLGVTAWGYDPTPFTFLIVILIYAVMLISDSTLDLGAVARRQVYNFLPQAIFVVGNGDTLQPGNRAALNLINEYKPTPDGPEEAEDAVIDLFHRARADQRRRTLAVPMGDRYYDVELQPITPAVGRDHPPLGWIIIADDVTATVRLQTELARAAQSAAQEAERDPLTGLSNRRPLEPKFKDLTDKAAREGSVLQLVMVDVDHFKSINDTYGHDEGDRALVHMADALRSVFREDDAVFRIGGEEFLVLAQGMPQRALTHRLRMARARLQETIAKEGIFENGLTFSAGIGEWPNDGTTLEQLVRNADRRLLEAKRNGRNQFIGTDPVFVGATRIGNHAEDLEAPAS